MANPSDDEEREKPLDPAVERVRRKLVRFVAINLGLLFLALMAVVVAIVYRASRTETPPVAAAPELPLPAEGATAYSEIMLPQGARIVSHSLSGGRLSLHAQLADGAGVIFVYDMAQGRMVGRFELRQER